MKSYTSTILLIADPLALAQAEVDEHAQAKIKESELGEFWRADKGVMLMQGGDEAYEAEYLPPLVNESTGKLDNRRTLFSDDSKYADAKAKTCVTFRLQQDFDYEDKIDDPAKFDWAHTAGAGDAWNADASLRADIWTPWLYNPEGAEISLALGYDIKRTESDSGSVDLQSFHLALPFVVKNIPFLESSDQVFQADISYNTDRISDQDGFDFKTNYTPTFKLPYGWIGAPCDLEGKALDTAKPVTGAFYNVVPKVGLSYGKKYELGDPTAHIENELVASYDLGVTLGMPVGWKGENDRILAELGFSLKGGEALTGGGSFNYQQLSLRFYSELDNNIALILAYRNGAETFDDTDLEQFSISLGIKL